MGPLKEIVKKFAPSLAVLLLFAFATHPLIVGFNLEVDVRRATRAVTL